MEALRPPQRPRYGIFHRVLDQAAGCTAGDVDTAANAALKPAVCIERDTRCVRIFMSKQACQRGCKRSAGTYSDLGPAFPVQECTRIQSNRLVLVETNARFLPDMAQKPIVIFAVQPLESGIVGRKSAPGARVPRCLDRMMFFRSPFDDDACAAIDGHRNRRRAVEHGIFTG